MKRTISSQPLQHVHDLTRALTIVQEIASTGSMSDAAWQLDMDVSAISRQVSALERSLGCLLFERHRRGVSLTESGAAYLEYARQVVNETQRMQERLDDLKGLKRGTVRIATVEAPIAGLLAPAIAEFHRQHAQIRFEIHRVPSEVIVQSVLEGAVEIGIGFNLVRSPGVEIVHAYTDTLCAGVSSAHPLASKASCCFSDIAAYPVAISERHSGLRRVIERAAVAQRAALNILLETNSLDCLRQICHSGESVTILTRLALSSAPGGGEPLTAVPIHSNKGFPIEVHLGLCMAEKAVLSVAADAFLQHLRKLGFGTRV
ncbi:MAG: LysR family transcriptional regulator [Proteobacteria bacterium]|nr:LysR family transcriptional regulator [Pseudomonadota bacterium]